MEIMSFEPGEIVVVEIRGRKEKGTYESQIRFSTNPTQDRFRVQIDGRREEVSRENITKLK